MIYIHLRGGLGNQMFQYAAAKVYSIRKGDELCIDLDGITNDGHNVYSLDKFSITSTNIEKNVKSSKKNIAKLFSSLSYRIGKNISYKLSYAFDLIMSPLLNLFGVYNVEDGYVKFKKCFSKNKYINGYLQSDKYFNEYRDLILKEFKVKENILPKNKKLIKDIQDSNSVCVHIRRGDYVKLGVIVCSNLYYINAIKYLNKKLENPKFYIFSNDIDWVKENIKFPVGVNYVEGNNPNYEELRLMYNCKNFIISNSTFSWWAQYLSTDKNKIVIAPSKWFIDNHKEDIYQENWLIMDEKGNLKSSFSHKRKED